MKCILYKVEVMGVYFDIVFQVYVFGQDCSVLDIGFIFQFWRILQKVILG